MLFGGKAWWVLGLTTLVGMVLLWRDGRFRWMVVGYLTFVGLFVGAMASDHPLIQALTAPWWNDRFRLSAVIILPATLASGWDCRKPSPARSAKLSWRGYRRRLSADAPRPPFSPRRVCCWHSSTSRRASEVMPARTPVRMAWVYKSPVLTPLERRGLDEVGRIVSPGEVVMNDRGDGTVWCFAISGRRPVIGHYQASKASPPRELLLEKFNQFGTDRAVADTIRNLNVRYVMVGEGHIAQFQRANGLVGLDKLDGLTPVYRNAEFQLYRVGYDKLRR